MFFVKLLENFYMKFPPLSEEIKKFIVGIIPPLTLVIGILMTLAAVLDFLGTPILSAFTLGGGVSVIRDLLIIDVLGIAQGILMIFAFRPLRAHHVSGWNLLFWSQVIWGISSLLNFSPSFLIAVVFFYPLFQVKSHYR